MTEVDRRLRLLDPPLFWRKFVLLVVFFAGFVVLKYYEQGLALEYYVIFLLALHVYVLGVFLWRVRWRVLAAERKGFAVRLAAIAIFIVLLAMVKFDVPFAQLMGVVALSFAIHTALLLSLTVVWRPMPAEAASPSR